MANNMANIEAPTNGNILRPILDNTTRSAKNAIIVAAILVIFKGN
jgi:hypothetical protein